MRKTRIPFVLFAILVFTATTVAGDRSDPDRPYWRRNLFKRVLVDQKYLVTTWWPAELQRPGFSVPLFGSVLIASSSSSSSFDHRVQDSIESWSVGSRGKVAENFTRLGDGETAIVLLGGTYLISRWTKNARMSRATSLSAEALLNGAIYSGLLKRLTRRTRPAADGTGAFFVKEPGPGHEPTSFPSGHATGAFAVATVFASEYRDKRWVPWVAYGTAGMIAGSRVTLNRHFPTDVIVGALLGRSLGKMVLARSSRREPARFRSRLRPLLDSRTESVGIEYRRSW